MPRIHDVVRWRRGVVIKGNGVACWSRSHGLRGEETWTVDGET